MSLSFSSIGFSAFFFMQSFIFSLICGLFLEFHCSLSGNTLNYMWNVRGAPTFSIQDDITVKSRSHQSKMNKIRRAPPQYCMSPCNRNNKNTSAAEVQNKCSPDMTNRVNQRVSPCPPCYSQLRRVMRWGDLSPQREDQRCFEPSEKSVPDFRGKKKQPWGPRIWCWTVFYVTSIRR